MFPISQELINLLLSFKKLRTIWRVYYRNAAAIIFVVDSADPDRFEEARETLSQVLDEEDLKDAKLLVFASKQDLDNAARFKVKFAMLAAHLIVHFALPCFQGHCLAVEIGHTISPTFISYCKVLINQSSSC